MGDYFGLLVGVPLAVVLFAVWIRMVQGKISEIEESWAGVAGVIDGTSRGLRLRGTYGQFPVLAEMVSSPGGGWQVYYDYRLTITVGAQGTSWTLSRSWRKGTWDIGCRDKALKQRLLDAGAVEAVQNQSTDCKITYHAKEGSLVYRNGQPTTAEEFRAQLDLLTTLAIINSQANVA